MATIVIFGLSLALALILLLLKARSLKKGEEGFLLSQLGLLDPKADKLTESTKFLILQIIQSVRYIFLVYLPKFIEDEAGKYKEKINKKLEIQRNLILGQKEIHNRGAVSFFLKKIDETKRNGHKGEINDSL